jgi:hypothetical protein
MDDTRFATFFRTFTAGSHQGLLRRTGPLAASLALLAALLLAGPTLSALRLGTPGNDTLVGTTDNDQINGQEGSDILKGKAGNDTYVFDDNFSLNSDLSVGHDTLVEKPGEGTDTVNLHAVTTGPAAILMVPEWGVDVEPTINFNAAFGPSGEVRFAYNVNGQTIQSVVENAIGGRGDGDNIMGGAGKNILQPGGGAQDVLQDVGGWNDGAGGRPDLPASNDVYKGFADNTGTDFIYDWGGGGDVLDMRPLSIKDVFVTHIDFDSTPATEETLQIVTSLTSQVIVIGQFGDFLDQQAQTNLHGSIETIRFADATFSTASALQSTSVASTEALTSKQARLAEAAEGLAKEARALLDTNDPLGLHPTSDGIARGEAARADRQQKHDTHQKQPHSRTRR